MGNLPDSPDLEPNDFLFPKMKYVASNFLRQNKRLMRSKTMCSRNLNQNGKNNTII